MRPDTDPPVRCGLRDLLFSRRSVALIPLLRLRWTGMAPATLGGLSAGLAVHELLLRHIDPLRRTFWDADVLLTLLWVWLLSELMFGASAIWGTWLEVRRWRRQQRVTELAATPLAPLEVGQLILALAMRSQLVFIASSMLALYVTLAWVEVLSAPLLIPLLFVAANAVTIAYSLAWATLALTLGLGHVRSQRALLLLVFTYIACLLPLAAIPAVEILSRVIGASPPHYDFMSLAALGGVAAGSTLAIKLAFARAFALQWSRSIFPGLHDAN